MLTLSWTVVSANAYIVTGRVLFPCTKGDTPLPDANVASGPGLPPDFEQDPYILEE